MNFTNFFIIIGSDGWADRQEIVTDVEEQAVGSISIRIHSPYIQSFDDIYLNLNPFDNVRNPWFKEFWEDKFNCKMPQQRFQAAEEAIDNNTSSTDTQNIKYCTGTLLN